MSARRGFRASERAIAADSATVEIRPLTSLADAVEPWKALAARAIEPNVFLEPAFALAAAPVLGADVQACLVWSQHPTPELLGLFAIRVEPRRYGLPLPVLSTWTHPFAPLGTPLVHRDAAELAISAFLDHILNDRSLPALLLMPYVRDDELFAAALDAVLARRESPTASYDRHRRALLSAEDSRSDYLARAMAPKRRKELARQWRRMEDVGSVTVSRANDIMSAVEEFFRLEASGWKGRAGTAAASNPDIRRFMTRAVNELAVQDRAAIYSLRVDDQAIAACIVLRSGQSAWCWKIAYDEAFARFSPGIQLVLQLTEDLLRDASIAQVDSLATPDHPMIDHLWRERCTISDRLIAVKPPSFVPFALVCRLEALRRLGRSAARSLREHLRKR
jgi:CelD/BcsL family acetyltransferase involved in cellulose biosynthesis